MTEPKTEGKGGPGPPTGTRTMGGSNLDRPLDNYSSRQSWLDTVAKLEERGACKWDDTGEILMFADTEAEVQNALASVGRSISIASFKKNMSIYLFKIHTRGKLNFVNDYYKRDSKRTDYLNNIVKKNVRAQNNKKKETKNTTKVKREIVDADSSHPIPEKRFAPSPDYNLQLLASTSLQHQANQKQSSLVSKIDDRALDPNIAWLIEQMNGMKQEIFRLQTEVAELKKRGIKGTPDLDKDPEKQLFVSILENKIGLLSQIIEQNRDTWFKFKDDKGYNPLMKACSIAIPKVATISTILEECEDLAVKAGMLSATDNSGLNCFLMCAKKGHTELLKHIQGLTPTLISRGALKKLQNQSESDLDPVIYHRDHEGNNALMYAAGSSSSSNIDTVKHLLESPDLCFDIEEANLAGETAMVHAIINNRQDVIHYLARESISSIHVKSKNQPDTALTLAISEAKDLNLVKTLVESYNCDIFDGGYLDRLPFLVAAEMGEVNILKYLYKRHQKATDRLLKVNSIVDQNGDTAMTLAAKFGNLATVVYLAKVGFEALEAGYKGRNAIQWSIVESNFEVVQYFNKNYLGCLELQNSNGDDSYSLAAYYSDIRTFEYVLKTIDVTKRDLLSRRTGVHNRNILMAAVMSGSLEKVKLVASSMSKNLEENMFHEVLSQRDGQENSLVMLAAKYCPEKDNQHSEVLEYLVVTLNLPVSCENGFEARSAFECAVEGKKHKNAAYLESRHEHSGRTWLNPDNVEENAFVFLEGDDETSKIMAEYLKLECKLKDVRKYHEEAMKVYGMHSEPNIQQNINSGPLIEENIFDQLVSARNGNKQAQNNLLQNSVPEEIVKLGAKEWKRVIDKNVNKNYDCAHNENLIELTSVATKTLLMDVLQVRNEDTGFFNEYAAKINKAVKDAATRQLDDSQMRDADGDSQNATSVRGGHRSRKNKAPYSIVEISQTFKSIITDGARLKVDKAKSQIIDIMNTDSQTALIRYISLAVKSKLEQTVQRIRRKLVYIVSYRRHQLLNRQVGLDASFNKYHNSHPDRPIYSAKSMLKLIRWCRFFEREYKPIIEASKYPKFLISSPTCQEEPTQLNDEKTSKHQASCNSITFTKELRFSRIKPSGLEAELKRIDCEKYVNRQPWVALAKLGNGTKVDADLNYHKLDSYYESAKHNFRADNCMICLNKEYCEYDYGLPLCQTCLYRRNLFLYGSELKCEDCSIRLYDDNFEGFYGKNYCKRCLDSTVHRYQMVLAE